MKRSWGGVLSLAVLAGSGATASPAPAASLKGIVLQANPAARTFTVSSRSGLMTRVRARKSPAVGRVVKVVGRRARGGRFVARRMRVLARSSTARVRGVIAAIDARGTIVTIASRTSSVVVNLAPGQPAPRVGSRVTLLVVIDRRGYLSAARDGMAAGAPASAAPHASAPGASNAQPAEDDAPSGAGGFTSAKQLMIDGRIKSVDASARRLEFAPEDTEEYGTMATIIVPPAIDISQFTPDERVQLIVEKADAGTYRLQRVPGDDDTGPPDPADNEPQRPDVPDDEADG